MIQKINICLILLLFSQINCAQTNKRIVLRDNHIKRIILSQTDSLGGQKYVATISFINDSGLVYKSICLNKQKDTIQTLLYKYDNHNREVEYKIVEVNGTSYVYNYEFLGNAVITKHQGSNNNQTSTKNVVKNKKNKDIIYHYKDEKLVQVSKYKYGKKFNRGYIKYLPKHKDHNHTIKEKEYKDQNRNIIRSSYTTYNKTRVRTEIHTEEDNNGKILKDRSKYRTYRYKRTNIRNNEYNKLGLIAKTIYFPCPAYVRPSLYVCRQNYLCFEYEYLFD